MFAWVTPIAQLLPILIYLDFHFPGFIRRWILGKGNARAAMGTRLRRRFRPFILVVGNVGRWARRATRRFLKKHGGRRSGVGAGAQEEEEEESNNNNTSDDEKESEVATRPEAEDDTTGYSGEADDDMTIIRFLQKKWGKHAGFFAESLVEALPQAILQLTGIMVYGFEEGSTFLFLFSIFLSIFVVSLSLLVRFVHR